MEKDFTNIQFKNAIHDNAVLGFQVEHNGPKNITDETDASAYDNETHIA